MSATPERSPDAADAAAPGDLFASAPAAPRLTLGSLPLGARLVLRCRKDWRAAAVAAFEPDLARVVLSVASPSGHTYRLRRPAFQTTSFPISLCPVAIPFPVSSSKQFRGIMAGSPRGRGVVCVAAARLLSHE